MILLKIYLLVTVSFLLGYVCRRVVEYLDRECSKPKPPKRKWPSAYIVIGLLLSSQVHAQTIHVEPSFIMSSRFALGAGLATTANWNGNIQAQVFGTWENKRAINSGLAAGVRLYTTSTDVDGWFIAGATHTWHSPAALASGEGLRNGVRPMVGFRFDYKPAFLQIEYNIEAVYLRCGITLFNHQ